MTFWCGHEDQAKKNPCGYEDLFERMVRVWRLKEEKCVWRIDGTVHLFVAQENGYEFMYLSARAISQSATTRAFLSGIRQDGKSLPDGPIVISPDGMIPSLYREGERPQLLVRNLGTQERVSKYARALH